LIHSSSAGELFEGAEDAAFGAAPLQFGQPSSGLVDPGRVGGSEVQHEARVGQQPAVDHRCFVGGQVVADHVDRQAGAGLTVDLVQEVAEVHGPVLGR
jgi:hypothetical protein